MSVTMYRNKVQGLEKEIASIEKNIGKEQEKLAKALKTIQRTNSTSTLNSKQREVINTQKKIGDLKGKKADSGMSTLN